MDLASFSSAMENDSLQWMLDSSEPVFETGTMWYPADTISLTILGVGHSLGLSRKGHDAAICGQPLPAIEIT